METLFQILIFLIGLTVYFIPSLAMKKNHRDAGWVVLLNIFLGWTVVAWFIALVWGQNKPANKPKQDLKAQSMLSDIVELKKLKDEGAIDETEFKIAKNRLFDKV